MATLTPQQIADLAQVQRPVISVWRRRYDSTSSTPFPTPVSRDPLHFDAGDVSAWLRTTERGNNPEAHLEALLHSTAFRSIADAPDRSSALLLLHSLTGGPVETLDPQAAEESARARGVSPLYAPGELVAALTDKPLSRTVDALCEAAFAAPAVLDRLIESFVAPDGPWATEALTAPGRLLVGSFLAEVHRAARRCVSPSGPGGLVAVSALVDHLAEIDRPVVHLSPSASDSPRERAGLRRLAAHGVEVASEHDEPGTDRPPVPTLRVFQWQTADSEEEHSAFANQISELVAQLAPGDALVVIGPATLMTSPARRRWRTKLLQPAKSKPLPLRFASALPKGLSRFGGQRQLALWVFGQPGAEWTAIGSSSALRADAASATALASDVSACLGGVREIAAHAFEVSTVVRTAAAVAREGLSTAADTRGPVRSGGERLATLWQLHAELSAGVLQADLFGGHEFEAAATAARHTVSLVDANRNLVDDFAGTRLRADLLSAPVPGTAVVIGQDELRDHNLIGTRAIDRLLLEQEAPRAQLTEPGDVIYVAAGGPAAMVDRIGGHVVLAPARFVRCRHAAQDEERRLLPPVVAADIAAQASTDRRAWRLRTVAPEATGPLASAIDAIAKRRADLARQLRALDSFERELIDGIADAALVATPVPAPPRGAHEQQEI